MGHRLGVGGRLLAAFFGISAFGILAAGVGMYSLLEMGGALDRIARQRLPAALASQDLSRQAERIAAIGPSMLTVAHRGELGDVSRRIAAEVAHLNSALTAVKEGHVDGPAVEPMESAVRLLQANLDAVRALVEQRLAASDDMRNQLRGVRGTHEETQRLVAPWALVVDTKLTQRRSGGGDMTAEEREADRRELEQSVALFRLLQRVQLDISEVHGTLNQIALSEEPDRLRVSTFRIQRALRDAQRTAEAFDPRLRRLLLARLEEFRPFIAGPGAIPGLRERELALVAEARQLLSRNTELSRELTNAVDRLVSEAKENVATTTVDAARRLEFSTPVLAGAVALSLLSSILIFWLYVGRNVVRRITALSRSTLAIAEGRRDVPLDVGGDDEVTAMSRAVEVFRRNAIELDKLLAERAEAATRLERLVEERTAELARREAQLRAMFDNMSEGIAMFSGDGRLAAWNRQFRDLFDIPETALASAWSFEDFIRYLAERGEFGPGDVETLVRRRAESVDDAYFGERTRPDGTILEVRRSPVPGGGFISMYADITERKKAQDLVEQARARLTDAIESISDGFALWDEDDRLVTFNRRAMELLNAEDLFVAGASFESIVRNLAKRGRHYVRSPAEIDAWVERRLALHRSPPSEHEQNLASGTWLLVREYRTQESGTVTTWADITAVKRREKDLETALEAAAAARQKVEEAYRDLKEAQANLVHAEKMASLGQLTAGIAHEIKNPLNFVNNFAGLSIERLGDLSESLAARREAMDADERTDIDDLIDTLKGNLSKIIEHGSRADGIVKSMLLHSRGGSGERQHADLNALVEEALNLAYHGARASDPDFNITLERDLDPRVGRLDVVPQDMLRVFLNLIGNGFYATVKRKRDGAAPDYRPVLKVVTRAAGDDVEVRVRDNGVGISPDVRPKLFTPFFTTKRTGEGTGLGLSISYDIVVQQHGGSIAVDSQPGEFAEFTIRLPRGAAAGRTKIAAGGGP